MRKIVFIFIALIAIGQNVCAQGMTATLQSGDNLSVFYGVNAFKEAYEEAKDGGQITLSAGTFNAPDGSITKSVKITGVGAYEESANTYFSSLTVSGTDIRIEGICFQKSLNVSGSKNLIVKRCWVNTLNANSDFQNAFFVEDVFKYVECIKNALAFTFSNCTIGSFSGYSNNNDNVGNITNCVLYSSSMLPWAIYRNNILGEYHGYGIGSYPLTCAAPSEFYYNALMPRSGFGNTSLDFKDGCIHEGNTTISYNDVLNATETYPAKPQNVPTGNDGTPIGPNGGTGFSQYPAIPRIISKNIDGKTNDDGKINVKIEVKAEN